MQEIKYLVYIYFITSLSILYLIGLIRKIRRFGYLTYNGAERSDKKVVIITGATSGIGLETTKELAMRGAIVIMACRNLEKARTIIDKLKTNHAKLKESQIIAKELDLCSEKSIKQFAAQLEYASVDILINNAGVVHHPYEVTTDGHEIHMATNYLGHFLLTHLLLDKLKNSPQGRIINVASGLYQSTHAPLARPRSGKPTYSSREYFWQSKLAVILTTSHMATLLEGTSVTVNSVNPGVVWGTGHMCCRGPGHTLWWLVSPMLWTFADTARQGAQTSLYLALNQGLQNVTGKYFSDVWTATGRKTQANISNVLGYKHCYVLLYKNREMRESKLLEQAKDHVLGEVLYNDTCKLLNISSIAQSNDSSHKQNNYNANLMVTHLISMFTFILI